MPKTTSRLTYLSLSIDLQQLTRWVRLIIITTKRCSPILLHDNARPHTPNQTKKCLSELNFEVLPHPPYSPDMPPTDFHIFRSLQHFLAEKIFNDIEEAKNCLHDFFASKHWDFYYNGMHKLKQRWRKISLSNGLYITD